MRRSSRGGTTDCISPHRYHYPQSKWKSYRKQTIYSHLSIPESSAFREEGESLRCHESRNKSGNWKLVTVSPINEWAFKKKSASPQTIKSMYVVCSADEKLLKVDRIHIDIYRTFLVSDLMQRVYRKIQKKSSYFSWYSFVTTLSSEWRF